MIRQSNTDVIARALIRMIQPMRPAAAILLAALSTACLDPDVPLYTLSPSTPTVQVPTALTIVAVPGIGATAKNAFVTATLKDQDRRAIDQVMLSFVTSKGTIEPPQALTNVNGEVRATLTSGTATTVTVAGAGLQASIDITIDAPLTVMLTVPSPEKNVPVNMTATVASDAVPPLSFVWEFGDGQTATTASGQVTHQYRDDGTVTIRVTVTDALERKGSISTSVFVRDNP
jgi:PKD repeat protein